MSTRLTRRTRVAVSLSAMPYDITMCPGEGCPLRDRCYRARAVPLARQDWLGSAPYNSTTNRCELFWDLSSLAPNEATIRDRAYAIWQSEGCPEGRSDAHWQQAREELERAFHALLRR